MEHIKLAKKHKADLVLVQRDDALIDIYDKDGGLIDSGLDAESALSIADSVKRFLFCHKNVCDLVEDEEIKDVIDLSDTR
ncbi:hypothetical protein DRP07_00155 [Archaeoglobales archaeon]|nr:MAG: hypothetical protein DRP07_00155 [Archaeoglobales archaeon]